MQDSNQFLPTPHPTRRTLLKAAGAGGALLMSVQLPLLATKALAAPEGAARATFNAVVRIGSDDVVTLVMPRVEMGQGVYTALSMMIAEELEVDLARVRHALGRGSPAHPPGNPDRFRPGGRAVRSR